MFPPKVLSVACCIALGRARLAKPKGMQLKAVFWVILERQEQRVPSCDSCAARQREELCDAVGPWCLGAAQLSLSSCAPGLLATGHPLHWPRLLSWGSAWLPGLGPLMCHGGLKMGRVRGQEQVREAAGRQILCPAPRAAPRLEAVRCPPSGAGGEMQGQSGFWET